MKVEAENELIEFQTWLNLSIRHAWSLAFAVAVPGAFLLTLWFPQSTNALIGVAILGVAIGVISEAVENAKRRRLEEMAQLIGVMRQIAEEITATIKARLVESTSQETTEATPTPQVGQENQPEKIPPLISAIRRTAEQISASIKADLKGTRSEAMRTIPSAEIMELRDSAGYAIVRTQAETIRALRIRWGLEGLDPSPKHRLDVAASSEYKLDFETRHALIAPANFALLIPEIVSLTPTDEERLKEIAVRVLRIAEEMDIPATLFWRQLDLLASVNRAVSKSAEKLEEP